jgi:hypothetical protein
MRAAAVEQECTGAGGEEGGGQATATAAAGVAAGVNTATAAAVPPRIEEAGGIERFREFANPPGVHGKPSKHTCRGFQLVPGNIRAWYKHETGCFCAGVWRGRRGDARQTASCTVSQMVSHGARAQDRTQPREKKNSIVLTARPHLGMLSMWVRIECFSAGTVGLSSSRTDVSSLSCAPTCELCVCCKAM